MTPSHRQQPRRSAGSAEQDERYLQQFGPRLPALPWSGPSGAQRWLSTAERATLGQARAALADSWLTDPLQGMITALRCAAPGTAIAHGGARGRLPPWVVHDAGGRVSTNARQLVGDSARLDFGRARLYGLEGGDRFAERPVNLATLVRRASDVTPLFELLHHVRLVHQLRVVCYDGEARLLAYFGSYRPEPDRAFTLSEHALLHALVPDLRRWFFTARVLGVQPLQQTGVLVALDANQRPACLVRQDGVLVFANRAARGLGSAELARLAQQPSSEQLSMAIQSERFTLVLLPQRTPLPPPSIEQLPLSLQRVARSLAEGCSDKEIAAALGLSLASVRTYAVRIYRRLGLTSRRELMRLYER